MFSSGGQAQHTLSGQALKVIFKMNKYLHKFTSLSVAHRLDLFEKLISPVLNYASEVWGFIQGNAIERIHLQFCKKILGVKLKLILYTENLGGSITNVDVILIL